MKSIRKEEREINFIHLKNTLKLIMISHYNLLKASLNHEEVNPFYFIYVTLAFKNKFTVNSSIITYTMICYTSK